VADLVVPNLKPDPIVCARDGCGIPDCTAVGRPTKNGHPQGCTNKCVPCKNRRNHHKGKRKQNVARKRLGIPNQKFGVRHEEHFEDNVFGNEVKAGAQVGPVANFWMRTEKQVVQNQQAIGAMKRPARVVAMPDGWGSDGIVLVRLSTWDTLVRPALDEFYGPEGGAA